MTLGYKEVSSILFLSILYPLVLWVLNHVQVEIILKEKLIAVMFFGVVYGGGRRPDLPHGVLLRRNGHPEQDPQAEGL